MAMQRIKMTTKSDKRDDLYVEITYQPNANYASDRWRGHLCSDANDYSVGGYIYGMFEWVVRMKARRLLARKRRERMLSARANEYGRKVIR